MSVARVTELSARSPTSFEDATAAGIERANTTFGAVEGAWIKDQKVVVRDGQVTEYQVIMKVTYLLGE